MRINFVEGQWDLHNGCVENVIVLCMALKDAKTNRKTMLQGI